MTSGDDFFLVGVVLVDATDGFDVGVTGSVLTVVADFLLLLGVTGTFLPAGDAPTSEEEEAGRVAIMFKKSSSLMIGTLWSLA